MSNTNMELVFPKYVIRQIRDQYYQSVGLDVDIVDNLITSYLKVKDSENDGNEIIHVNNKGKRLKHPDRVRYYNENRLKIIQKNKERYHNKVKQFNTTKKTMKKVHNELLSKFGG